MMKKMYGEKFLSNNKCNEGCKVFFLSIWHRVIFSQDLPYSIITAVEFNPEVEGWIGVIPPCL
ncbi:hypothetical protein HYC85_007695 [Camellia sinensis]|uniref:Uncharacterized protein n=1 Tax=Camellia sinensis TaxID=4442 RepID=A0A7J7HQA8_CAMSI|nr:hypothetical protein HYC85_007695 [Camellia sinensis]